MKKISDYFKQLNFDQRSSTGTCCPTVPITVMSRNLYLGADVGVALAKIPNMPAAAQFMWDQVQKTDFSQRKKILADQIRSESPDVIGIQEATIWYCKAHFWTRKLKFLTLPLNYWTIWVVSTPSLKRMVCKRIIRDIPSDQFHS
jgi:hypothetical protein